MELEQKIIKSVDMVAYNKTYKEVVIESREWLLSGRAHFWRIRQNQDRDIIFERG